MVWTYSGIIFYYNLAMASCEVFKCPEKGYHPIPLTGYLR